MKTIHLVSHTHWDREWYRTFQQFRLKLVHLVDGLIDILENDLDYKHFMLDGQTIILGDYLQMRPEAESTLKRLVQDGRLHIGPWHILPDMFLVSPEAHIRNLLAGDREARRFGPKMMIGYMPDSFGHIGQMPQILCGFGINNACLWRGLDDQPAELWWQSPDGSRVLMLYMRDSYSNGAGLNTSDLVRFTEQIQHAADSLAPYSAVDDVLVMFGTDHMEPAPETSNAIQAANSVLREYCVEHSTLPAYLAAVQASIAKRNLEIPVVAGELRSSKRSHLLPGVLSTRMWIKQRNHICENLLEKWAEPFSTFASLLPTDNRPQTTIRRQSSVVRHAWQLLMQCHPHDSICGCSIDSVHDEMRPRFDQVEQIGEEITKQSLDAIAACVQTDHGPQTIDHSSSSVVSGLSSIVVFNPLSAPRTDIVTTEISLPSGITDFEIVDEAGNIIPHQSASGETTDLINVRVRREELGGMLAMVNDGKVGNLAIQNLHLERIGVNLRVEAIFAENASPRLDVWNHGIKTLREHLKDTSIESFHIHARSPDSANITFAARDVPGLGWKAFYLRRKENAPAEIKVTPIMRLLAPLAKLPVAQKLISRLSQPNTRPPHIIENDLLSVKLNTDDRTLTVTEKATGTIYRGLNCFVDSGDCGDEYNFASPAADSQQASPELQDVTVHRGPVQQRMTISLILSVPAKLTADRRSRSREMVNLPIKTTVTLTNGVARADIHTQVENHAEDHRLRVHFPAPFAVDAAQYDGHFEIVKRPIGIPASDPMWIEEPRPEVPQRAFTSVTDGENMLTIANRGLPEVEVTQQSEIVLTLLRCVGWLSRDDFTTRTGHAGPFLETPGAQMPGLWEFDYSIIVGEGSALSYQQAWDFASPLRAVATDIHAGILPSGGSMVAVDNPCFVVSTIKSIEDGRGWIVRGYNIRQEEISVTLMPWRKFEKAEQVNLAEETVSRLDVRERGEVTLKARGCEVVTVMFGE